MVFQPVEKLVPMRLSFQDLFCWNNFMFCKIILKYYNQYWIQVQYRLFEKVMEKLWL